MGQREKRLYEIFSICMCWMGDITQTLMKKGRIKPFHHDDVSNVADTDYPVWAVVSG